MPPDTTLANLPFDPKIWLDHLDTILSIIGGGGLLGLLAKLKQWYDRRSLRKRLGAALYTRKTSSGRCAIIFGLFAKAT